jgi:hypothetical protein
MTRIGIILDLILPLPEETPEVKTACDRRAEPRLPVPGTEPGDSLPQAMA